MASLDARDLRKSMAVNFYGHQWVSSAAVQVMLQQGSGGLCYNISKAPLNPGAKLGPYVGQGCSSLMRQYAVEYEAHRIRTNAVNADRVAAICLT